MNVYKDGVWQQGWTRDTGLSHLELTEATNTWTIGTGTWNFVIEVWGTDYGLETCRLQGQFKLINS